MSRINISELIFQENHARLDKVALVDSGVSVSYGDLQERVKQVAEALSLRHVKPLHRVALLCHDSIDYVILSLAVLSLDAAIVPIAPDLMSDERQSIPERMDVHFILADLSLLQAPLENILPLSLGLKRTIALSVREAAPETRDQYAEMRPAFIRFSSGTTGASKGVVLSHETIRDRTDAANDGLQITPEDTIAWVLSMSFHFVVTILLFLRKGATIIICGNPIQDAMVQALKNHPITLIYASPIHYRLLTTSTAISQEHFKTLRLAVSTAVRLPEQVAKDFFSRFQIHLAEAYGVIEVGLPFLTQQIGEFHPGRLGKPLPAYTVRCGEDGTVYLRGKGLFDGYFSPWTPYPLHASEGWFDTGDLGELDADGGLTLVGRLKAVINFAGMKIFPQEVEEVLNQFPAVAESLVYGEPHAEYGQLPSAQLVLTPGTETLNEPELLTFCKKHLSTHKIPKSFRCVDQLPKTASGKIRRY
jgi:long-chain acyl-CoA synthetase